MTLEDGCTSGGVGSAVAAVLSAAEVMVPVQIKGIPQEFIPHASRGEILGELGLTAQDLARSVTATVSGMQAGPGLSGQIENRPDPARVAPTTRPGPRRVWR